MIRYFDVAGRPGKFPGLDNIRACAIGLVLLRHAVHTWDEPLNGYLWNFWYNGWLGVDLFFTLSGFLITYHLLSRWPDQDIKKYIYRYFVKRGLRILPLYVFILGIVSLNVVPFFEADNAITPYALLVHAVFFQDYISSVSIIVSLWSLGVEEKFYLLAPVMIYFARRYNASYVLLVCILTILTIAVGRSVLLASETLSMNYGIFFWSYRSPFHFSVAGILCGSTVALIYHKFGLNLLSPSTGKTLQYLSFFVLGLIFLAQPWVESKHWITTGLIIIISSVFFAFILYRSLSLTSAPDHRHEKALRFVSKLAYPLYLSHLLVIPLAKQLCLALIGLNTNMSFWLFFAIYITLSLFVSLAIHLAIEKPFLILKDRF